MIKPADIKKLLTTFLAIFESLFEQAETLKDKGFFMMPIHRMFSYFVSRVLVKACIESQSDSSSPAFSFHHALTQLLTPAQVRQLTTQVMTLMARHQGFVAEIKSRKWIYKGEQFQRLSIIKVSAFKEYFLTDLGLLQMMTVAAQRPSECIEILISNFGTDLWLGLFHRALITEQTNENSEVVPGSAGYALKADLFSSVPRFDAAKLGSQVRQLLLQLIQMCIYETSFLTGLKHLFTFEEQKASEQEKSNQGKLDKIYGAHLKHVLIHYLFLFGASSSIEQIKKMVDPVYVKSEQFMQTLVEISDKTTDADGKIKFRLKEDTALLQTFDPYLIVQEQHQNMQQAAYASLHKKRACINDIVGDYERHYKFQTPVNRQVEISIANSAAAVKMVSSLVKQCFEVAIGTQCDEGDKDFRDKIFNSSLMNAALKLQLLISSHVTDAELIDYTRRCISQDLLGKMLVKSKDDEKLERILLHL